jgi:hypothetical protein
MNGSVLTVPHMSLRIPVLQYGSIVCDIRWREMDELQYALMTRDPF